MSEHSRRRFLETLLGAAAQASGVVVLASVALTTDDEAQANPAAPPAEGDNRDEGDLFARADRLADEERLAIEGEEGGAPSPVSFLNGGFRKGGLGGGFVNGGFRNGGFRKGGFLNGGFLNGGFRNGGFLNGGFRNGGFLNGGFRNF